MTTHQFATVGLRLLGIAAVACGLVIAGSSLFMRAFGSVPLANPLASDVHLHDTYYVVADVEAAGLVPGAMSVVVGLVLLVTSRRLGKWLAREMES